MVNIISKPIYCPLCQKPMGFTKTDKGDFYYCIRPKCMISINKLDPLCGIWDSKIPALSGEKEKIECPNCRREMKYFLRSDGYLKCVCKCGVIIENDEPDRPYGNQIATG